MAPEQEILALRAELARERAAREQSQRLAQELAEALAAAERRAELEAQRRAEVERAEESRRAANRERVQRQRAARVAARCQHSAGTIEAPPSFSSPPLDGPPLSSPDPISPLPFIPSPPSPASSASELAQPSGQLSLVGNDPKKPESSPTHPPLPTKRGHVPNAVSEWYEWAQAERKRQLGEDCPVSPLRKDQWSRLGEAVKLHGQELLKVAHRLFLGDEYARGQGYPTGLFVSRWEDWVGRAKASAPRPQHNLPIPAGAKPPVEQYAPGRPKLPTLEEARKLGMVK